MKKNMGLVDRALRVMVALVVAILYIMGQITGTAAIVLGALSAVFLLTSLLGFCPLYLPFKLSTDRSNVNRNS